MRQLADRPDFYDGQQLSFLDDEERRRINAFDWEAEFPEIMKAGGFDAVIGNPPYSRKTLWNPRCYGLLATNGGLI